ncbi:ubiquitin carboxyl-terminal hydrolase 30-like isoform X2 [Patiria miniata]|uniref:ubiquitinyl hydrolase 1 n=1 Tax=Patiria miniata TaxID=46514 RepID=A0A914ADB5_PATMI|nr:ubiquitin carboxyl-terminal hydrolase 30-like isoform X2 [Patiria miniata]
MLAPRGRLIIPEKYLPFLGVGAAVAVTLTYIFWGPDGEGRSHKAGTSKRRKVAGLENLGNTCYLNTILQSLASCPAFVKWLSRALRQGFFKGKHNELAYKLSKTLEVVNDHSANHSGSQVYSPHEVLHALYGCSWRADRDQQDAHELFQFLLSVLGEEREPISSPVPLCDASRLIEPGRNGLTALHSDLHSNIEANLPKVACRDGESPFRGLLANHLLCTVCGHRNPVTYSSFDCLTLPLPTTVFETLSLECILAKFTQRELVQDVECTECSKKLAVKTAPPPPINTAHKVAPPSSRRITPPTPKKVRTAQSVSAVAPPTFPVAPPCSANALPRSRLAPPYSTTILPPPIESTDNNLTPAEAPPAFGQAPPTSYQMHSDLHVRTPPSEELPSNVSDSSDQEINGRNYESVGVSSETAVDNRSDAVLCYHGNGNLATDASSVEKLQEHHRVMENSAAVCNGSLKLDDSEETHSSELKQNGIVTQNLHKATQQMNGTSFQRSGEQTMQETEQTSTVNGSNSDLEIDSSKSDRSLNNRQAENPSEKIKESVHHKSNFQQEQFTELETISERQDSSYKLTPPKCQSTPKPRLQPLIRETTSSSANQSSRPKDTPTSSIFGRIPGTSNISPSELVIQPSDGEESAESSPKCRRRFHKQLTLGKLPQCLCVHLQRVTWLANGLPSRREEHVMFPEYLDMSPYKQTSAVANGTQGGAKLMRLSSDLSEDGATPMTTPMTTPQRRSSQSFIGGSFLTDPTGRWLVGGCLGQMSPRLTHNASATSEDSSSRGRSHSGEVNGIPDVCSRPPEARYRLASAVVHVGDAFTGHFLTFRRAPSIASEPLSENWLCISDESVYASTAKEVFSQKAYMLYYQRT